MHFTFSNRLKQTVELAIFCYFACISSFNSVSINIYSVVHFKCSSSTQHTTNIWSSEEKSLFCKLFFVFLFTFTLNSCIISFYDYRISSFLPQLFSYCIFSLLVPNLSVCCKNPTCSFLKYLNSKQIDVLQTTKNNNFKTSTTLAMQ